MNGLFITIEGIDGAGKTTQMNLLKEYLERENLDVLAIREPGGTPVGEKLREILLDVNNNDMSYLTEAFLYATSRAELVTNIIRPAFKKGSIVLCDRFIDSSLVYQGIARNLGVNFIKKLNNMATGGLLPDITFLLNISPDRGLKRKKDQKELDRMENEKIGFYKLLYSGYEKVAEGDTERIKVINADDTIENVHQKILDEIDKLFKIRGGDAIWNLLWR